MSKTPIRIQEPSDELRRKISLAREHIATQKQRVIRCPYCRHKLCEACADAAGHIELKCSKCGRTAPIDFLSMRRIRLRAYTNS